MAGKKEPEAVTKDGLSRSRFLKLAGLGAGLSLFPGSLASPNAAAGQAVVGPDILNDARYPIVAWWPPPPVENAGTREAQQEATDALYAELAGAGFNAATGGNKVSNVRASRLALEACGKNDLRFVISDEQLRQAIDGTATAGAARSEAQEEPRGVLQALAEEEASGDAQARAAGSREAVSQRIAALRAEFGNQGEYPALAGISLYDEPGTSLFGILRHAKNQVEQQFEAAELPYINVWPSYADPRYAFEAESYTDYLGRYLNEERYPSAVVPPVLSFDHYPLLVDERTTTDFFYNHAVIRDYALRFGVPSWAFIQSMDFDGRRVGLGKRRRPDEAGVFWQINVALAYGVKGIQYFTYWTPEDNAVEFGSALITRGGERTALYGSATRANEFLRKVGAELLPLRSTGVYHANEQNLPRGAKPFQGNDYVKNASGDPAILGFFSDPEDPTVRYMLVTNRSPNRGSKTRLTVTDAVTTVERFDTTGEEGAFVAETLGGTPPRFINVSLAAGRARLYRLRS